MPFTRISGNISDKCRIGFEIWGDGREGGDNETRFAFGGVYPARRVRTSEPTCAPVRHHSSSVELVRSNARRPNSQDESRHGVRCFECARSTRPLGVGVSRGIVRASVRSSVEVSRRSAAVQARSSSPSSSLDAAEATRPTSSARAALRRRRACDRLRASLRAFLMGLRVTMTPRTENAVAGLPGASAAICQLYIGFCIPL